MASQTVPKMSVIAQYDDLCRYSKVLTRGCEEEFKIFAEDQKNWFRKRKDDQSEIEKLKEKIKSLENETKKFELQRHQLGKLLEAEINRRKQLEQEKDSMERQIALIKEVLLSNGNTMDHQVKEKLFLLSNHTFRQQESQNKLTTIEESIGSLLSPSDIDDTEENIDVNSSRRRKRRSKTNRRSSEDRSQKKKKSEELFDTQSDDIDEFRVDVDIIPERKGVNFRSSSEPNSNSPEMPTPRQVHRSDSEQIKSRTYDLRVHNTGTHSKGTPVGRYSTGGKLSRTHDFVSKTVIRTEKCYPCGRIIKFCKQARKCSDCRVTCHPECEEKCPLPCIPVTFTPTKHIMGTIADYTSSTPPMIPSLIVQCVNEIESRGLKEIGLYRISGPQREVKDLKEKLLKRNMSTLNQADIHAICGTIKDFLRSLKDSIVSRAMWQTFVDAAEHRNISVSLNDLYEAVCNLPQPNKETLAFLILHLQRVAEAPDCKMPIENLAKIFGPTIVGHSVTEPSDAIILTETPQQEQVMKRLLSLPSDSWKNLLNIEMPEVFHHPMKTPEITSAPVVSRLGPIYSSGQKPKNVHIGRTPLTPRSTKYSSRTGRRQFFNSPLTK